MNKLQQIVDLKKAQFPEDNLQDLYKAGTLLPVRPLRKREIRRMYFKWLKTDTDNRSFQQIWEQRVKDHLNFWQHQLGIMLDGFTPQIIGEVVLTTNEEHDILTITSDQHQPLTIKILKQSPPKLKEWATFKIKLYSDENIVNIDTDKLLNTGSSSIETTVLLG